MLEKCLECSETSIEVSECSITDCPLYPIRLNRAKFYDKDDIQHFKRKCLDCCCGQIEEVKQCPAVGCPLNKYKEQYYK